MPRNEQVSSPVANQPTVDSVESNLSAPGNPDNLRNPAKAPVLTFPVDEEAMHDASEELQNLLKQDKAKLSPDQLKTHNKRVHELHYLVNGEQPPKR